MTCIIDILYIAIKFARTNSLLEICSCYCILPKHSYHIFIFLKHDQILKIMMIGNWVFSRNCRTDCRVCEFDKCVPKIVCEIFIPWRTTILEKYTWLTETNHWNDNDTMIQWYIEMIMIQKWWTSFFCVHVWNLLGNKGVKDARNVAPCGVGVV